MNDDADATLDYLVRVRKISPDEIFVLGRSIGTGPAAYLASKTRVAGLILESPFSSIEDAAAEIWFLRVFPVKWMLRTHLDNLSRITSVQCPLLIVSGTDDRLTPPRRAEKIFQRANQPKQLHLVPGAGHDDLLLAGGAPLTELLRSFVQQAGHAAVGNQ